MSKRRFVYAVMWLNVRNQRRVRWFDDYNTALNFRAEHFSLDRSAIFKCKDRIGL